MEGACHRARLRQAAGRELPGPCTRGPLSTSEIIKQALDGLAAEGHVLRQDAGTETKIYSMECLARLLYGSATRLPNGLEHMANNPYAVLAAVLTAAHADSAHPVLLSFRIASVVTAAWLVSVGSLCPNLDDEIRQEIAETRRVVFNLALYAVFNTLRRPGAAVVDDAALIILALSSGVGQVPAFLQDNGLGQDILNRMAQWVRGQARVNG